MNSTTTFKNDYQIGIITALPIERAAVTAMLDTVHDKPEDFFQAPHDPNNYTWGRMGLHNVVIASLSAGVYGTTMATTTAMDMLWSFQSIRFGLMVGIGGGVPIHDVRLGDVVVSQPSGISGGVFQYDLGKAKHNEWERRDFQARPPDILLKALGKLQTEHEFQSPRAYEYLETAITKHEYWGGLYSHPDKDDRLFQPSYLHNVESFRGTCSACDGDKIIERSHRLSHTNFRIHYGTIASGNSLVKDAKLRDWIASMEQECVCIEMEAAGLMNNFPCLVIRGICDYADSHKNDAWQRYACATAAALAKELLSFVPITDAKDPPKAVRILQPPTPDQIDGPIHSGEEPQQAGQTLPSDRVPDDDSALVKTLTDTTSLQNDDLSSSSQAKPNTNSDPIPGLNVTESRNIHQSSFLNETTINARLGEKKDTLLHSAARKDNVDMVSLLLKHDVDIEARNKFGLTPLFIAAREGHLEVARLLVEHNANVEAAWDGSTPLHIAAGNGHLDVVKLLIEHNAEFNAAAATKNGLTPLHIAAREGHLEVARLLIEHNANVEAVCFGSTPLHIAAENRHLDMVKLLIDHNANIEAAWDGFKPLYVAVRDGRLDMVKLLVEHKANLEGLTKDGWTSLQTAVWCGHLDIVEVLLRHGADPETRGPGGTALEIAKRREHHEIARLLEAHKVQKDP